MASLQVTRLLLALSKVSTIQTKFESCLVAYFNLLILERMYNLRGRVKSTFFMDISTFLHFRKLFTKVSAILEPK